MLCEIRLLGRFRISVDGHAVADGAWRHRRAAELVKILALTDRHRLHREQIIDMLWPDLGIEAGGANLRKAVHFARRTFDSEAAVELATGVVQLWPHAVVRVDAALFEDAAHSALASKDPNAAAEAAGMYHGDVLPEDRYAEWADEPRERLRSLALQVLKAASMWERVLELEQADEEAHRALMQRSLESGDRVGAIRHFERLRERLRTDLGMGPDQASIALYEKALAAEGREPPTPSERTRALIAWGIVHLNAGDLDEAQRSAGEARALALESNLGPEVGEASALLGIVANMQGRWKELFRSEFMESVRRSPDIAAFVFDAHLCLAEFCMSGPTGHREIVGYARELLDVAEASRSVQGAALAELLLGEGDLFTDELGPAEKHLRRALDLHEQAGSVSGQVIALQRLAEVAIARGTAARPSSMRGRDSGWRPTARWRPTSWYGCMKRCSMPRPTPRPPVAPSKKRTSPSHRWSCALLVLSDTGCLRARHRHARGGSSRQPGDCRRRSGSLGCGPGDRGMRPCGKPAACCEPRAATSLRPRRCSGRRPTDSRRRDVRETRLAVGPPPTEP